MRSSGKPSARVVVLGLDGVPWTFLDRAFRRGRLPRLQGLAESGAFLRVESVLPTVSSVAWTTIMTGANPARHGLFGFVDRGGKDGLRIPTSRDIRVPSVAEHLGARGMRVAVVGVPPGYPPRGVNGIEVPGFLCTDLKKGTHPPELAEELAALGYVIDVDPEGARRSKADFPRAIAAALEARRVTILRLLARERWDLFIAHVMDTDRINHFLWADWEDGVEPYASFFDEFYDAVDRLTGDVADAVPAGDRLLVLSDHGFCRARGDVFVNRWLEERGWLRPSPGDAAPRGAGAGPPVPDPESRALSLIPGRIFLLGNEAGAARDALLEEIAAGLLALRSPSGDRVVHSVHRREEIYDGPLLHQAADLIARPADGWELKGTLGAPALFAPPEAITGVHTFDDAFLMAPGLPAGGAVRLVDIAPTICSLLDEPPPGSEGTAFL